MAAEEPQERAEDHRFADLKARLSDARARSGGGLKPPTLEAPPQSMVNIAYRLGVEVVVAVAVGGAIGYLIDKLAGTYPWFMLIMFFLGAAAGLRNVVRASVQLGLMDKDPLGGDAAKAPPIGGVGSDQLSADQPLAVQKPHGQVSLGQDTIGKDAEDRK